MPAEKPIGYEPCKDPDISNIWVAWFLAQLNGNTYLFGGCTYASNGWCLKLRRSCVMGNRVMELYQAYESNAEMVQLPQQYGNGGIAFAEMSARNIK